ncbi:DUF4349 domain-containing protein [Neobacillus piezotolerans]|uniref:DUF4349 domain-containing protein n=1 Tax=Neobacillus piezotolerans TaxID=2259171 RepID=A0A3D8GVL9_9BACI|nr:DUF4349 domain-containing protein [Neobacillus piezotolerans]RDU38412.1 DUF4349 domain-containing protein [Neobacillus piezotolerans]
MERFRKGMLALVLSLFAVLAACSNAGQSDSAKSGSADQNKVERDYGDSVGGTEEAKEKSASADGAKPTEGVSDRMVIKNAELHLRVKNFENAQKSFEAKAEKYGGYIVESSASRDGDEQMSGMMTVRVPAPHFESFLNEAEKDAAEVLDRSIRGEDVKEQYVDLDSRLKSKKAVEARLLEFMKGAAKTEDLLQISADLGEVQEEIEQITGKMKYLQNQSSLSTIKISLFERKIIAKATSPKELDTWARTKKQFISSTNFLLSVGSGLTVFFLGNLPILLFLAAVLLLIFLFFKKGIKRRGG